MLRPGGFLCMKATFERGPHRSAGTGRHTQRRSHNLNRILKSAKMDRFPEPSNRSCRLGLHLHGSLIPGRRARTPLALLAKSVVALKQRRDRFANRRRQSIPQCQATTRLTIETASMQRPCRAALVAAGGSQRGIACPPSRVPPASIHLLKSEFSLPAKRRRQHAHFLKNKNEFRSNEPERCALKDQVEPPNTSLRCGGLGRSSHLRPG